MGLPAVRGLRTTPSSELAEGEDPTMLLTPEQHQRLQQQMRQQMQGASRISSAISSVSADIHFQRITRSSGIGSSLAASSTTGNRSPRTSMQEDDVGCPADAQGLTTGIDQQQHQQQLRMVPRRRNSRYQPREQREGIPEIEPAAAAGQPLGTGTGTGSSRQQAAASTAGLLSPQRQQLQHLEQQRSSQLSDSRRAYGSGGSGGAGGFFGGVNQLQLLEVIGAGSFGVVYRASWR